MINIGVIGCGRISEKHFEAIQTLDNIQCLACCDIRIDRAKKSAQKYDIPLWTHNYDEILSNSRIDLISICTPSGLHPLHGIMAAQHGKHVLTEKPMAVRTSEANALIRSCQDSGVELFVLFQNRFNPAIQLLRRAFEEGRFGKIYMIIANILWTREQEYYDMAPWRGTWELDGGAFLNQASHYVDILQWFGGRVNKIFAITATLARKIEGEDTGSVIINFANKTIGCINVTMLTYPQNLEGSITIIGEKGTAKVSGLAMNKIEHWSFEDEQEYDKNVSAYSSSNINSVYGNGHLNYYNSIINLLMEQKAKQSSTNDLITGIEGRKSLEIIEKIYVSREVTL